MACYFKEDSKLGRITMHGKLGAHCSDCTWVAENLCDYPVGDGKTCDRKMCEDCSHEIGNDIHYCKGHYEQWLTWKEKELTNVVLINQLKGKEQSHEAE